MEKNKSSNESTSQAKSDSQPTRHGSQGSLSSKDHLGIKSPQQKPSSPNAKNIKQTEASSPFTEKTRENKRKGSNNPLSWKGLPEYPDHSAMSSSPKKTMYDDKQKVDQKGTEIPTSQQSKPQQRSSRGEGKTEVVGEVSPRKKRMYQAYVEDDTDGQ